MMLILCLSFALLMALAAAATAVMAVDATRPLWMPVPVLLTLALMGIAMAVETRATEHTQR